MDVINIIEQSFLEYSTDIFLSVADLKYTYGEIDVITKKIAGWLQTNTKINQRIVLIADHSIGAIIYCIAILRSGRTYIPISSEFPYKKINSLVSQCDPDLILLANEFRDQHNFTFRYIETKLPDFNDQSDLYILPTVDYSHVLYSIFTSGTTNKPKLVEVLNRGIYNLCKEQRKKFNMKQGAKVLQFASISFDASIAEILVTLYSGAELTLPEKKYVSWLKNVNDLLENSGCDIITLPPSVYNRLTTEAKKNIHTIIFAGEYLSDSILYEAKKFSHIINAYGPTEATVCFSINENVSGSNSIGKPIEGFSALIYNEENSIYSYGGKGELVIAGEGVGKGYYSNPELTFKKFRFVDDKPVYHTGDFVKIENDEIWYLGRSDFEVKLLGHRINLESLEIHISNLLKMPCILLVENNILYALFQGNCASSEEKIKEDLKSNLAHWEIPSIIKFVPQFPVTINGKIDRKALQSDSGLIKEQSLIVSNFSEFIIYLHENVQFLNDISTITKLIKDANFIKKEELLNEISNNICLISNIERNYDTLKICIIDTLREFLTLLFTKTLQTKIDPNLGIYDLGGTSLSIAILYTNIADLFSSIDVSSIFQKLDYNVSINRFIDIFCKEDINTSDRSEQISIVNYFFDQIDSLEENSYLESANNEAVVITGASGFIGAHILNDLLNSSDKNIICISNSLDKVEFINRFCRRFNILETQKERIIVTSYAELNRYIENQKIESIFKLHTINRIIHCGFEVNHLKNFENLCRVNLTTTLLIAKLAIIKKTNLIQFLSALSIGADNYEFSFDRLFDIKESYSQVKFIAENMFYKLIKHKVNIHLLRLGLVYGHNKNEEIYLAKDNFFNLLAYSKKIGKFPNFSGVVPFCHVKDIVRCIEEHKKINKSLYKNVVTAVYESHQIVEEIFGGDIDLCSIEEWTERLDKDKEFDRSISFLLRKNINNIGTFFNLGHYKRDFLKDIIPSI